MGLREANIEKRRQRILAAAREIIASKGPDALSMRTLARRAGLSVTTLYNLLGSKDEILLALIETGVASVRPALEAESAADPLAALQRMAQIPATYLAANARIFQPMITAGLYQSAGRAPQMQALYGGIIAAMENLIRPAQKAGYLKDEASARLIAAEIFYSFRTAIEDWGCGLITSDALARRLRLGLDFVLLAQATEKSRGLLRSDADALQEPALADLGDLFPGLGGSTANHATHRNIRGGNRA